MDYHPEIIKAFIFDLDNCLAPAKEVGEQLCEPAFAAMRIANRGTVPEETLREAFSECWRHPFDFVAANYGFSNEMVSAGWDAFSRMEVETPMRGYPDLDVLRELTPDLYLVTSGFRLPIVGPTSQRANRSARGRLVLERDRKRPLRQFRRLRLEGNSRPSSRGWTPGPRDF
jgi:hypothetical protein